MSFNVDSEPTGWGIMLRRDRPVMRGSLVGCVLLLLVAPHCAGRAQGVPVIDQSAVAAAQQNLTALQQQLQQLRGLVQTAQNLSTAIGSAGTPPVPFQSSLAQSGISQFSSFILSALGASSGSSLSGVLAQINQIRNGSASVPADFTNFTSAQQWVGASLTTSPTDSATAKSLGRQARAMVAGESAADGYAMALTARQQISAMASRAQVLANQVTSATTLREDIASNTAVMLALHDEMAEIQALLASLLAIQASDQLVVGDDRGSPVTIGTKP